jgi:lysyl-tRNA synthetase class 2
MSDWQPASGPGAAARRARMKQRIRAYFAAAHVLEVDTPVLSPYAVSDPQIESLEITRCQVSGRPLYLHTSPEFCMKRLLAADYPDIYSMCRVFRDGESGRLHQPEFTMLEWYRLGMGLDEIVADTVGVISAALDRDIDVDSVEYRDAFIAACGLDPFVADIASLAEAAEADDALRAAVGDERDDWLDLVLATRVTPQFAPDHLTVLRHYPASQAALARLCPDDNAVADRFEVFLGPVELANGYVELTDSDEQLRRIEADNVARRRRGRPVRPVDELLLAALESGLPDCAGVALGLERLLMLFNKTDDIGNVITFTFQADA